MSIDLPAGSPPARVAFYNDPRVRSIAYQVALCAVVGILVYGAARNAIDNLERAHIASGFGFWNHTAGFDISQTLIGFNSATSSYGRAFWVGLLNTLLVAGLGIVFASILGFIIGIARLSKNWLVAKTAAGYVETIRNIPLLLQLLFWYNAVLKALPAIRDSLVIPGGIFLNNRGLFMPVPVFKSGFGFVLIALAAGIVGAIAFYVWARKRQERTGQQAPVFSTGLGAGDRPAARRAGARRISVGVRISGGRPFQYQRRHRGLAGIRRACCSGFRSIPRPSSPKWCAPASPRCRAARPRRPIRWACGRGRPCG